jgi:hypothetical protein
VRWAITGCVMAGFVAIWSTESSIVSAGHLRQHLGRCRRTYSMLGPHRCSREEEEQPLTRHDHSFASMYGQVTLHLSQSQAMTDVQRTRDRLDT